MLKFYYNAAPNPMKVALMLEELGVPYEPVPVDSRKGEQHAPSYVAINPNAKVPAIVDDGVTVFDSNAILLYLADKFQRFVAPAGAGEQRAQTLSWLMFVASGIGPYSGQCVHFRHAAPPNEYALNRYDFEAHRHWKIVDDRLSKRMYMLGADYGVVDMAVWGWARMIPFMFDNPAIWSSFPNVKRLLDEVNARPAAAAVEKLRTSHSFKAEMDDEAKRHMFPQNERLARRA